MATTNISRPFGSKDIEFRHAGRDAQHARARFRGNFIAALGEHGLELGPQPDQVRAHLLDRIVLLAHAGHLVLRAVLRRIGHGMAAIAVGLHLEDVRALAGAGMLDGALAGDIALAGAAALLP